VSLQEALNQAEEAGLDLAEIAPNAQPPVVKILDWGKYKYEQTKQLNKSRKHQKSVEVKEVRVGLKIGSHDLDVKLRKAHEFLADGNKVKVSVRFRGREITHPDLGHALLARVMERLSDTGAMEQAPQLTGRDLNMVVGVRKDAKNENSQGNGEADQAERDGQDAPTQGVS
jgi:translation initiation factor IF-3